MPRLRQTALMLTTLLAVGALCISLAPQARAMTAGTPVLAEAFDGPDALVTNEFATWHPHRGDAHRDPTWVMWSGSLFRRGSAAWTGNPDGGSPDRDSQVATGSAVFRMASRAADLGPARLHARLRVDSFVSTERTPAQAWDGVHVWLRRASEESLYYVSVARRDGALVIKKKCPGGPSNGGTYHQLGSSSRRPVALGGWFAAEASVVDRADGSVAIDAMVGSTRLTAVDAGVGCAPIADGSVGFRGDNTDFSIDDILVHRVGAPPPAPPPLPATATATAPAWHSVSSGGVVHGSDGAPTTRMPVSSPVAGVTGRPGGGGWVATVDGGVFSFGGAPFLGSLGNVRLNQPIAGIATTPTGRGYTLVATDGGIFTFGDATYHGSLGNLRLNQPITGIATTPTGRGYTLVATDGGIFCFGDATFRGRPVPPPGDRVVAVSAAGL